MPLGDFTASDVAWIALAVFLVLVALGLAYASWRLGALLGRVTTTVERTEAELLPVLAKTGGALDRVNTQLDRADTITESAADAVLALSKAVRGVSAVVSAPVQALAGLVEGARYGFSSFRTSYDVGEAVRTGREAAERRRRDLAEELGERPASPEPPPAA